MYLNSTGYATSAFDYTQSLLKTHPELDLKVDFYNRALHVGVSPENQELYKKLAAKPDAPDMRYFQHCIPPRYKLHLNAKKNMAFCIFESINIPQLWINAMNRLDCIVTASNFNKSCFETQGVKVPIHIIPHCFNPEMFNKDIKPKGRYDKFTFFAMGTWKQRKNWETLIKGFYEGFEQKDNVCLLIKTDKPDELKRTVLRIKQTTEWRTKDTCPIYSEDSLNCNYEDIPSIIKKADCYICPSLGEGFNLGLMQSMALGIPTIVTRFGGVLDYAKPNTCTYLEPKEYKMLPSVDGVPQFSNCVWPFITIEEVAKKMREVRNNWPKDKIAKAYDYVHQNFNYDVIGNKLFEVICA